MRNTVYLEASARTRDLLDAQRALRAAKWVIGSTWHDRAALSDSSVAGVDWITERYEELDQCDALIILCGEKRKTTFQVPLLAGYALARGLQVIWIGSSLRIASNNANMAQGNVVQFDTVEEFCDTLAVRLAA
ncbi:MAG: hypothetical protein ACR2JB_16820 [Bryobacteraceae bacterium]